MTCVSPEDVGEASAFEALLDYLKTHRAFDFTGYKRASLERRMRKRLQAVGAAGFTEYQDYLEVHPEEFPTLFNTILINVTSFFRDRGAWKYLAEEVVPSLVAGKGPQDAVRVWSAGCASGEEAYSLAMVLAEALGPGFAERAKIYATDADEDALVAARSGVYGPAALENVPEELRDKYFEQTGEGFRFKNDPRRALIFGRHDITRDAPISHLDLLVCRNTLMYFNAEAQSKILERFHFALLETGYLFLGRAEMLLTHADLFRPVSLGHRVFAKVPGVVGNERTRAYAESSGDVDSRSRHDVLLQDLAFDAGPLAQIVVDAGGTLVLANKRARSLLPVDSRDLGRPLSELEISYRPVELRERVELATTERRPVVALDVERVLPEGEIQHLDVTFHPLLGADGGSRGVAVAFEDVSERIRIKRDLDRHSHELETAYEELQSTNEELETTNEELQSTNEELETTNEEFQSTNEELETMNEELQSTNEEIETTNEELRLRSEALDRANAFTRSILASLHVGVAVVDSHLDVLAWNERSEDLWGLRAEEVLGQPLTGLDIGLPVGELREVMKACLGDSGHVVVRLDAVNRRGRQIPCQVTCTPLFDADQARLGVVLVMEDGESPPRGTLLK